MTFLRNAWYCAGFADELKPDALKPITLLGEAVALFRRADGTPAALADRCPHRFAPLSMGQVCDGQVQCAYHGLRFDASGQCRHNPHGDGSIPKADGPSAPSAHWLTPETETTTHYFWAAARDRFVGNTEVSAQMAAGFDGAFRNEDEPMIEACQRNMGTTDLMSLKPVLLPTDGPAIRARRVLAARLELQRA